MKNNKIFIDNDSDIRFFSAKNNCNMLNDIIGTLSTSSNVFHNNTLNNQTFTTSLHKLYFGEKYNENTSICVLKNISNITLYNFSPSNYLSRFAFRYLFTKFILGDDYFEKDIFSKSKINNE